MFEIASRADAVKKGATIKPSVFVGDQLSKWEDYSVRRWNFFKFMRTFDADDRVKIQKTILEQFVSIDEFNTIIKEASRQACKEV